MDETKFLEIFSKTKTIPTISSLVHIFPSEFFPEVPGCSQVSLLKSPVLGGSGI
jgi:hypothetical protein